MMRNKNDAPTCWHTQGHTRKKLKTLPQIITDTDSGINYAPEHIIEAAKYYFDTELHGETADFCHDCPMFSELPPSMAEPGFSYCAMTRYGDVMPYDSRCIKHKDICEHQEVLRCAYELFFDDDTQEVISA